MYTFVMFVGWSAGLCAIDPTPLACSVKVAVVNGDVTYHASGTVIRSQPAESEVITCWHTFRGVPESAVVKVEHGGRSYSAKLKHCEPERDLAWLIVETPQALPVAMQSELVPSIGDQVSSCGRDGNGTLVTRLEQITAVDRYSPPPNLETNGTAELGRSGGGLFDARGRLLGVLQGRRADGTQAVLYVRLVGVQPGQTQRPMSAEAASTRRKLIVWKPTTFACPHCVTFEKEIGSGDEFVEVEYRSGQPPWIAKYTGEEAYPLYEWRTLDGRWKASYGHRSKQALRELIERHDRRE